MLKDLPTETLATMPVLELIRTAWQEPEPSSLFGLSRSRHHLLRFGSLTTLERQLAGAVLELRRRISILEQGDLLLTKVHTDCLKGQLYSRSALLENLLYDTLEERIEYDHSSYNHLEPADDGNIYACPGDCLECIQAEAAVSNAYQNIASKKYGLLH